MENKQEIKQCSQELRDNAINNGPYRELEKNHYGSYRTALEGVLEDTENSLTFKHRK